MTPFEIIGHLYRFKSLSGQKKFLRKLSADDNFWFEAHHGLSHFTSYPYSFVLQDQKHAGQVTYSQAPNVLRKILDGMLSGALNEAQFSQAIRALSLRCHADEWEEWYEPSTLR